MILSIIKWNIIKVLDDTINANGLYVILKASSNKAGFI